MKNVFFYFYCRTAAYLIRILRKVSEKTNKNAVFRFGIYILKHALSKDMPDKAQKKGAALTNRALGL